MKLELKDISKSYMQGDVSIEVLSRINFKIEECSSNLILGPSGSGKTTLIDLISLLKSPSNGEIRINGMYTTALSNKESTLLRRREIGIIRQRDNLLPYLNLLENVNVPQISSDKKRAAALLQDIGINELKSCPRKISFFNQQKAALARALINTPTIILADEPTGELNTIEAEKYMELILNNQDKSIILVFSNNSDLKKYFENIFYLKNGNLTKR